MNHPLLTILRSLRDIEGVLGSFIWLQDGRLLASDVPESCPPATLQAVAERVQRLYDALVSTGDTFDNTTLAYSQYKLHVCAVKDAFIGAVLSSHVNMSALKMAVALARRDLSAMLIDPRLQDAINSVGRPPEPPANERPAGRSYRGHRIPD
jgi:predicted regulator of Ras-like GTPase activity (Roadblock/LC7/MglB family)